MKRITKRLIERRFPICGTTTFMVVDEQRYHLIMEHIYAQDDHLNRKLIQEALPFLEPFARELVKTGYCQKCQEILLHSKLKEEEKENYFTVDDVAGKKMDDFIEYKYTYGVEKTITDGLATGLSMPQKLILIHELDLWDDVQLDDSDNLILIPLDEKKDGESHDH